MFSCLTEASEWHCQLFLFCHLHVSSFNCLTSTTVMPYSLTVSLLWIFCKDRRLNNNSLTGEIPGSLTTISTLQVLWVSSWLFSPHFLQEELWVTSNFLSFSLFIWGAWLSISDNVEFSDLSYNHLKGTTPVNGSFTLFTPRRSPGSISYSLCWSSNDSGWFKSFYGCWCVFIFSFAGNPDLKPPPTSPPPPIQPTSTSPSGCEFTFLVWKVISYVVCIPCHWGWRMLHISYGILLHYNKKLIMIFIRHRLISILDVMILSVLCDLIVVALLMNFLQG